MRVVPLLSLSLVLGMTLAAGAAGPAAYDVPRLNRVVIDGDGADWKDGGFRIEALAPADGRIRPTAEFDAAVRVAWRAAGAQPEHDGRGGLLVLVSVVDADLVESADPGRLTDGDCVQIAASVHERRLTRFAVSPGLDPQHAAVRVSRDEMTGVSAKEGITAAVSRTRAGYRMEAFISSEALGLGLGAAEGVTVDFNVAIHDADARGRGAVRHAATPLGAEDTDRARAMRVLFGLKTSEPRTVAVAAGHADLRWGTVTVVTSAGAVNQVAELGMGPSVEPFLTPQRPAQPVAGAAGAAAPAPPGPMVLPLAYERIARRADRAGVTLTYSFPPIAAQPPSPSPHAVHLARWEPPPPLNLYLDSKKIAEIPVPDLDRQRRSAVARMDLRFAATVFAGDAFPACDLDDPAAARDLIGPYALERTFYNAAHEKVDKPDRPGRYGAVVRIVPDNPNVQLPPRCLTLFKLKEKTEWTEEELRPRMALPPQLGIDPRVVDEQQAVLAEQARWLLADRLPADADTPLLLAALTDAKPGGPRLAGRNSIWAQDQRWWFPLKQKLGLAAYKYHVDLPRPFAPVKKAPLLLFLHGSGERGDDLKQVRIYGPGRALAEGSALRDRVRGREEAAAHPWDFVVVSPQCPPGEWWSAAQLDLVVRQVEKDFPIEPDRVYVTGLSMGGYGTWELAAEYPDRFAAIAPVCGAGSPDDSGGLRHLPAWMFHGRRDAAVPFARSAEMFEALKKVGGRAKLTAYPDAGHDAWTATYDDPALYDWLLDQKRGAPKQPPAEADAP